MPREKKAIRSIKIKKRAPKEPKEDKVQVQGVEEAKTETQVVRPAPEASETPEIKDERVTEGEKDKKNRRYYEAVGRRKTAVARVRLLTIKPFEGDEGKITVNGKFYKEYFPTLSLQQAAEASLRRLKSLNRFEVVAKVKGGGVRAQSEAVRHGLARTLVLFNADFRKKLKKAGYMKRDPRAKERKKYGLKKARRAPQWAKR